VSHDVRPYPDVRQPAEHPARRVNNVELAVQIAREIVDVRVDEASWDLELVGESGRGLYRGGAEVRAGDLRAEARP